MHLQSQTIASPNVPIASGTNWRRTGAIGAGVLAAMLGLTALALLLSPIGQRWRANQTAAAPIVGAVEIDVLADDALNHIFAPAVTQVAAGTTVTWRFLDVDEDGQPVPHNVVFDDEASPVLTTGSYERTFTAPGIYPYVCTLHAFMEGSVVVTE